MKQNSMAVYAAAIMFALLSGSCLKEGPETIYPPAGGTTPIPPVSGTSNSFLRAYAGGDHTVMLPPNFFNLNGGADHLGLNNPNLQWHWTNISGPSNALIEFADSSHTKVRNPLPGKYEFELTVSFLPNYVARDTISVEIRKLAPVLANEIILNSSNWVCDWGYCSLKIPGILQLVPPQTAFLVYLKRAFFSDWLPIENGLQVENYWSSGQHEYYYQLVENKLTISTVGNNFTDNAQVKLVY